MSAVAITPNSIGVSAVPNVQNCLSSDISACYRDTEKNRIVAALVANSSLLVVGEAGSGKSALAKFVAADLRARGFTVAHIAPNTAKQTLVEIAHAIGVATENDNGRGQTSTLLQAHIEEELKENTCFLILDDAQRLSVTIRCWLEKLLLEGQNILLFATQPPARDVFLKLPRIELKPLPKQAIRELMQLEASTYGMQMNAGQLAELQAHCGGNPMLAHRVVREQYLGLEDTAPDHTEWIDGTPLLICAFIIFTVFRFVGRRMHEQDMMLFGSIMMIVVMVLRILILRLPRRPQRLGA